MRIIFIGLSGYDYPFVRVRCYDFARELEKHGVSTKVISFRDHLSDGLSEVDMWNRGDLDKLRMNLKAFRRLLCERGSIFYIQKIHYNAAAPFLLARLGLNKYILDYDDWDHGIHCFFKRPWLNRLFWGRDEYMDVLKEVASRAMCCVVSSELLAEKLSEYNRKVFLIPTGVDVNRFSSVTRPPRQKVVFGWNGVVWGEMMYENIVFMLECFSKVAEWNPHVAIRMVGSGQFMREVKKLVNERYAALDIEIRDWIHFSRMPDFLSSIDIGLLPLIQVEDLWVNSKSPTKYFEFLASGLPTVASPIAEIKRFIQDGEHGFLAINKAEFIKKMSLLVKDKALREKMGRRARELVEKEFSIQELGNKLFSIITETVQKR